MQMEMNMRLTHTDVRSVPQKCEVEGVELGARREKGVV